eukprot:TRINITY_DN47756_c0_g1_i1.p1 TRINITY_DN47756_c0_g1~~TRINITY_DN47756_c0_g1_i1.p1  ORF type:complete len:254 (+),score=61.15 TRINITY_DN47756_c0_g1_i1:66-827(+)
MAREYQGLTGAARMESGSSGEEEEYDGRERKKWSPVASAFAVFVLCGAAFALGRASSGSNDDSRLPGLQDTELGSGRRYSDVTSDDEDNALAEYEQAAHIISADWFARPAKDNNFNVPPDGLVKAYHQTSPQACEGIMRSDFRLGGGGWCGHAVYFALTPEATKAKAVTEFSGHGCMIEATIDVKRIRRMKSCGKYNALNRAKVNRMGFDTLIFEPPERSGDELIIFDPKQVVAKRIIPFNNSWMSKRWWGKR